MVPIFVSSGRSGLTLLGMIFGSHPDLAIAHEPRFLATMAPKHAQYEGDERLDVDRFLADLYSVGNFRRLGLPKSDVKVALETDGVTNFSDAVRVVFELYARSKGKPMYGDKTPLYITFLDPIAELLPETAFRPPREGSGVTSPLPIWNVTRDRPASPRVPFTGSCG